MSLTSWTTLFRQIHRPTWRGRLRHAALSSAALGTRFTGLIRSALNRPRVHFVYLHHVFDDEVDPFRKLLKTLTTLMHPIDYSEGVERILSSRIDRPYVTFSLDDGLKNCLTAAKVLEEFDARACFFVCPGIVGERDHHKVVEFARNRLHLPPVEFMNWKDLESLLKRGHEIGNHTRSHVRLANASPPPPHPAPEYKGEREGGSRDDEISASLELLRSRLGDSVRHFAWPYGNFNAITSNAITNAFGSGHRSIGLGPARCARRRRQLRSKNSASAETTLSPPGRNLTCFTSSQRARGARAQPTMNGPLICGNLSRP